MTLSAHNLFDKDITSLFCGSSFSSFSQFSDLAREAFKQSQGAEIFRFTGAQCRHTGASSREYAAEKLMDLAKDHRFSFDFMESACELIEFRVTAPLLSESFPSSEIEPSWLWNINNCKSKEIEDLAASISSVMTEINLEDGCQRVNSELKKIVISKVNEFHVVAVLRAIANYRHKLSNWQLVLNQLKMEFGKRDLKPAKILKGLDVS